MMQAPKHPKKVNLLAGLLMGTFMAFFMSAFITAVNTGIEGGFIMRWMKAFGLAVMAAVPLAIFVGPRARGLAMKLIG